MKNFKILLISIILFITCTNVRAQDDSLDSLLNTIFKIGNELKNDLNRFTELSDKEEMEYGEKIAVEFNNSVNLTDYQKSKIERIGDKLIGFVERDAIVYKFRVIETEVINAFAIAGGNIYVTSALIDFVENEDELAFVIGHEIGHIDKKHSMQQVQYSALGKEIAGPEGEFLASLAFSIINLPFNKYQEYEADESGAYLSYKGGYDPYASLNFFVKLANRNKENKEESDEFSDIFRTHPYSVDRKDHLNSFIKNEIYENE